MKTTNLVCNVCRRLEVLDGESSPHVYGASRVGWFTVQVGELRQIGPRPTMASAMEKVVDTIPEEQREAARGFVGALRLGESEAFRMPEVVPVQRSADVCPTCAPKALGSIMPHLTTDAQYAIGYGGVVRPEGDA